MLRQCPKSSSSVEGTWNGTWGRGPLATDRVRSIDMVRSAPPCGRSDEELSRTRRLYVDDLFDNSVELIDAAYADAKFG